MIRGLSFQRGIFFIGKEHVACAYDKDGERVDWVKPIGFKTLLTMIQLVIGSMPKWFKWLSVVLFALIFIPKIFIMLFPESSLWRGLPFYSLLYYAFGTHFTFPNELRKYHGAEHKVFSDRGVKKKARLYVIRRAAITNRNCSTNFVVIYFLMTLGLYVLFLLLELNTPLMWASYLAAPLAPLTHQLLTFKSFNWLKAPILKLSYYLQVHVTTKEPERKHLLTAIHSYRKLAEVEFPEHLIEENKQEVKKMAIVDVTVIPIGTNSASVSEYVAEIQTILEKFADQGKLKYTLTPMSTVLEGELPTLFEAIQAIHDAPFQKGAKRVATTIRIDERRDKQTTMEGKLESVKQKLPDQNEE
ncbi:MAG TPA: MTH1187 family thiamine-binding protein [Bacilli bacterium]|nr:MTH1187 family thiamine-binding protein [Bacilli bacterium]